MKNDAQEATAPPVKRSFRERMHLAREEAIVQAVNRLLAERGFEAMTVDDVAAEAGVAKASLYRHFPSKEHLAAAAMVRMLERALAFCDTLGALEAPLDRLKAVARWAIAAQLAGEMPSLPSQSSTLRATLMAHEPYLDALMTVSDRLGEWIDAAQADGSLDGTLPPQVVLYTLFARGCDPVVGFLKAGGLHGDDEIVELVTRSCFDGLRAR